MAKKKNSQAEFVRWFGPLLDALRQLGGSAKPREASDKIAENLGLHDDKLNELLSSGHQDITIKLLGRDNILPGKDFWTLLNMEFGHYLRKERLQL